MACQYDKETLSQIIGNLKRFSINCLAIDFDKTLISTHTHGKKFKGDLSNLVESIRPIFRSLIPSAHAAGIHIIVVTFSPEVKMIREILSTSFPGIEIVVRGKDNSWEYSGRGSVDGKQHFMASAFEELTYRSGPATSSSGCDSSSSPPMTCPQFNRASTLLIDDDYKNIEAALRNGTPAVLYNALEDESDFVASLLSLGVTAA